MDLTVSSGLIAALAVQLVVVVGLPILLLIFQYRRSKDVAAPAVVGMVVYMVFVQVLQQILHYAFLLSDNAISNTINGSPWIYAIYVGLSAGLFEETGRYMGYKYLLKKKTHRDIAISYGIGHGGYECIAIAGLSTLSYLVLAGVINSGMVPTILEMYSSNEAAMVETMLAQVAKISPFQCLWSTIERVIALAMQMGLSVLVFASVRHTETYGAQYFAAIVLHTLAGIPAGLYQMDVLSGNRGMAAAILLNLLVTLVTVGLARRIWRQLPQTAGESRPEEPKFRL